MAEPKPGIPFGFPVYVGQEPRDTDGRRVDALGGFVWDRLQPQPPGLRQVATDVECPFCHARLMGLSTTPTHAGRCVFDDGQQVLIDPLPSDVEPLFCATCLLTFYQRTDCHAGVTDAPAEA